VIEEEKYFQKFVENRFDLGQKAAYNIHAWMNNCNVQL